MGGHRREILAVLAITGVTATVVALTGRASATFWAVALLGSEYAVFILGRDSLDLRASLVGTGLLVLADLIDRSVRSMAWVGEDAPISARGTSGVAALWIGSLAIGSSIMIVAEIGGPGGTLMTFVGALASVAIFGIVLVVSRGVPRSD